MNILKKITSIALTVTTIIGISPVNPDNITRVSAEENKLSFTVAFYSRAMVSEENGLSEFFKQLGDKLDCNITWICPDNADYDDYVKQTFTSGDMPDVMLLDNDYLEYYAYNGRLWDMKEAWDNSQTKNSGKLSDYAIKYIEYNGNAYTSDNESMYGFSPQRGQGIVTYIKASELRKAGYDPEVIKNANLTFDEYYEVLKNIKKSNPVGYNPQDTIVSPPGYFYTYGNLHTQYLPEFYQDAKGGFYRNSDGEFVDGFTEQAMVDALNRISTAVDEGVLDRTAEYSNTMNARNLFIVNASKVLSYYSGAWGNTLRSRLDERGADSELIAIKPVNNGKYIVPLTPAWAIIDKKDGRQQQIFDKFIDTMLDGRDIQMLWTYGVKGVHWDTKAETVTTGSTTNSYKEGEFHMLPRLDSPKLLNSRNFIEDSRSLREFDDDMLDGQLTNPMDKYKYAKEVKEDLYMVIENSEFETSVPYTPEMDGNIGDINTMREEMVREVAMGYCTVEQAMEEYKNKVGKKVETVLEGLNKYKFTPKGEESSIEKIIENNNLSYSVNKNSAGIQMLTGVGTACKADTLKAGFGKNVVLKSSEGIQLADDAIIGTGCVVELTHDGNVIDTVNVVVKGDTDGTGTINVLDMEVIQKSILGIGDKLDGAYREAASLSGGDGITVLDMEAVQKDILGIEKIN